MSVHDVLALNNYEICLIENGAYMANKESPIDQLMSASQRSLRPENRPTREGAIRAILHSEARKATLELGAAMNSPIHKAMNKLAQSVWELAEAELKLPK